MRKIYYHFTGNTLRNGEPIPKTGKWLEYTGDIVLCKSGLHASPTPSEALQYAPGNLLHKVYLGGTIVKGVDKLVASRRKIVATIDTESLMREFSRKCALSVIHLWDAPEIVVRYLKTGDGSIRAAARDAAWATAWAAAWDAARDAAWDAARDAAWAAARDAARDAAWAAARDAARDAARAAARAAAARTKQSKLFNNMVKQEFEK